MHRYLQTCIDRFCAYWREDPRVTALSVNGSGGRGADDEWSDADLLMAVKEEAYPDVCRELRALAEELCGEVRLWLPEGETGKSVNFAFLFESEGEQFLFDYSVIWESVLVSCPYIEAGKILFDKTGSLTAAGERFLSRPGGSSEDLAVLIDSYLIYTYLNGKYYRRRDVCKMLYIQDTLMTMHTRLYAKLYPDLRLSGWWCMDVKALPPERTAEILLYRQPPDCDAILKAVFQELDLFSRDAREACAMAGIAYPMEKETYVRRQLVEAGAD